MSAREPWLEPGYGDVESAVRRGDLLEVVFANGDVVHVGRATLGITGDFTAVATESGAGVLVVSDIGEREVDWMVVRSAADPAFAQQLRERDAEEARRIGRRLRALRENREMSQRAVAGVVGMSAPQLAKLEQGETDMRVSTLRSLLRALGASFTDIAGPDAPEISVRELTKRAKRVGVPPEVVKRLAAAVDLRQLSDALGRAFSWTPREIVTDALTAPAATMPVVLKRRSTAAAEGQTATVALGETLARLGALAYDGTPGAIPREPRALRSTIVGSATKVTLEALVDWCWRAGIVVVPLDLQGGFSAGAWSLQGQPVVVIKERPDYKASWLFTLAHELGHLALGHVTDAGLVDVAPGWEVQTDAQEDEANAYALELLLPGHQEMLDEIRRRSQGPDANVKFKFKAISAANTRGYSPSLVLLVAAFGLPDVARERDRWGSAYNEAKKEGSAQEVVVKGFARNVDLGRLNPLDALLLRALALGS